MLVLFGFGGGSAEWIAPHPIEVQFDTGLEPTSSEPHIPAVLPVPGADQNRKVLIVEGYYLFASRMSTNDPFIPRPSTLALIFTCERGGHITDLRQGIRAFLTRFYPADVAMRMSLAPTYNYLFSKERSARCIILTAELPSGADTVLIDLYVRLQLRQCLIRTRMSAYSATLDGTLDHQRINAVWQHYFWMNGFFDRHLGIGRDRFFLN